MRWSVALVSAPVMSGVNFGSPRLADPRVAFQRGRACLKKRFGPDGAALLPVVGRCGETVMIITDDHGCHGAGGRKFAEKLSCAGDPVNPKRILCQEHPVFSGSYLYFLQKKDEYSSSKVWRLCGPTLGASERRGEREKERALSPFHSQEEKVRESARERERSETSCKGLDEVEKSVVAGNPALGRLLRAPANTQPDPLCHAF